MSERPDQTLAVFLLDSDDAARRFLKTVQDIDKTNDDVKIVDAAIADRTKRGRVKVHQTKDRGAMKGGFRGGAIGVVVGTILLGPAGAVLGGAAGGVLAGLHNRFHDIGIDDKFMAQVTREVDKGKSALFVQYEGNWSRSIGAIQDAVKAANALLIHSTLPADKAAALQELVETAAEELGGEEVVADYEVEEVPELAAPAEEVASAGAEGDDLTVIKGVGPKTAAALQAAGITSYARLASTSEPDSRQALTAAHVSVPGNVSTWAMQASFAAKGDWRGLDAFIHKSEPASSSRSSGGSAAPEPAPARPDDLTQLVGIGPKAARALAAAGITSFAALAETSEPQIRRALHEADMVPPGSVSTWPMQASLAAKGDWQGLIKLNQKHAPAHASTAKPKAAAAAGPDDLTQLSGIGPRIASLLAEGGVTTYAELEHMSVEDLRELVLSGGALPPSSLTTWPTQAGFAVKGDWQGLATYNKRH
jgi:predicted flap endonuclease-1-like 5' DNA nuclease